MQYCLDTSAWLEYFNAGRHGPRIKALIEEDRTALTPAVVASELVEAARLRKTNTVSLVAFIESRTQLVPIDAQIAREAGRINARRGRPPSEWTLVESLVLATARRHRARLLTRDPLFSDLDDAEMLDALLPTGREPPSEGADPDEP